MRKICVAVLMVLCLGVSTLSTAQQPQGATWASQIIELPAGFTEISSWDSFVYPFEGGLLILTKADNSWRIAALKGGKAAIVSFPDGKQTFDGNKIVQAWKSPDALYVTVSAKGLNSYICRIQGNKLVPLKDAEGANFTGYVSGFSPVGGLPLVSTNRELGLMKYINVMHVIRDGVVKPLKDADGKPVEAYKWAAHSSRRQLFSVLTEENGDFSRQAKYFLLEGDTCKSAGIAAQAPVPEGVSDTNVFLDRHFVGDEIVVLGYDKDEYDFRIWLERAGKPVWLKDGEANLDRKFFRSLWANPEIYAVGTEQAGDKERVIAYCVTGDKAESLEWPGDADPNEVWMRKFQGSLYLWQPSNEGFRYWRLNGRKFEPIVTPDGKPFRPTDEPLLDERGGLLFIGTGPSLRRSIYILQENKAVPIRDDQGNIAVFPEPQMMKVQSQPFVAWSEVPKEGPDRLCLAMVRPDGRLEAINQRSGDSMPEGDGIVLAAADGIYVQHVADGKPTLWWVNGK
jgi:hypothetical protein